MLTFNFFFTNILLGVGLAMDAFSVSLANGLNEPCMKQRKILSNLREKQFAQYKKEALVAEDNAVDDLVTSRHGYNQE